jgi:hypothetical protein
MAFAERPPQPPPASVPLDDVAWYQYWVALVAYLERMRASIP